ncbi:L-Ala-D/L-Glu epimerase [Phycisphaerae bacterium RAS1]|nr:L-Ala-D/L-Glu epimerase [Phycisphaerae bacterium RAS1]
MRLNWRRQTLRLRHRFATSRGGIDEKETIVVELEHDGVVGMGEIAPSALYGQSLESSEAMLAAAGGAMGDDPFQIEPIVAGLAERFDDQRAAIAGIDAALHDWVGKRLGAPVWRLLGLSRPRQRTSFTIGATATVAGVREKLREALEAGFDLLKVKVGTPDDARTLEIVRERFDGPLLLDANEAWTPAEAVRAIRSLERFRPAVIEQPLHRRDDAALPELRTLGVAPIIADESCQRPADVLRLHGLVDGVSIKFTKCGGVREALRMIALGRVLGMRVMLGCFVSSSLAIAPALAIASLVDFADLDGHLLLAEDSFDGIGRQGGELFFPSVEPGLGVVLRT